jgi:mannonate dehydratase
MHVGVQGIGTTARELAFLARHGVRHMCVNPGDMAVDHLRRQRDEAAEAGISLEMTHIGLARSITLAQDPARDRDLDELCRQIENAGAAGLRGLNYNFYVGDFARTRDTVGRGGSLYSTFRMAEYDNQPLSDAGRVSRDEVFDRIGYFLERVIPVAESSRVQLACHLNDPPTDVIRGVERWNYPVFEGLKRFAELSDSPFHGFNFCCGVAAEGLDDPGTELHDIVRYFAERKRIFNVHFRNIKGGLHDFMEVWPDEGDVDMYRLAKTLHAAGYEYMLVPDHMPGHPDDEPPGGGRMRQAWGFAFGYIIGLVQAVKAEASASPS